MAEHGLDEKVIGVAFDGTGYGTDGKMWGSEFMIADLYGFERVNHFDYFMLPGGDLAIKEPWRIAVSLLYKYYGESFPDMRIPFLGAISKGKIKIVTEAMQKEINSPLTSGAGRFFDAIAALTGLCTNTTYNSQGPMLLENSIDISINDCYRVGFSNPISLKEIIDGVLSDLRNMVPVSVISSRFHNTMVNVIYHNIEQISKQSGIDKVVLSGGVFQNAYLLSELENKLKGKNYNVYSQSTIPTNDGGIALGQLVIAAKRRKWQSDKVAK
jgi:hydrogenase maturation protein HypF